jgi:hypothetical protein
MSASVSFKDRQIALFRSRSVRFENLLSINAPAQILAKEGGLLIRALLCIVGGNALSTIGDNVVAWERRSRGLCQSHPLGEDHPIANYATGFCAGCESEAGADLAGDEPLEELLTAALYDETRWNRSVNGLKFVGESWTFADSLFARRTFHPSDINDAVPCGPEPDGCDGATDAPHRCVFHALAFGEIEIDDLQERP